MKAKRYQDGILKFNITSRTGYQVLLAMCWSLEIVVFYTRVVLTKLFLGSTSAGYAIVLTVVGLALVLGLPYMLARIRWQEIALVTVYAVVYIAAMTGSSILLSYYLNEQAVTSLLVCLPMVFVGVCIQKEDVPLLHVMSIVTMIAFLLYVLFFGNVDGHYEEESMSSAYAILMHVCTVTYFAVRDKKPIDIIASVVGLALLLFMGTRGPVVLSLSFLIVCLVFFSGRGGLQKIISIAVLLVATGLLLYFFDEIITFMSDTAESLHMSTRIFDTIKESEFTNSSGRDNIQSDLMKYVWEQPITGYGIAYDRVLTGHYAHNLLIEFWVSYGVILGSILILWLVFRSITAIIKYRKSPMLIVLLLLLFTGGFGKLLLSGSYITEHAFFMFIGVLLAQNRIYHREQKALPEPEQASNENKNNNEST